MAWENLEVEIALELSDHRLNLVMRGPGDQSVGKVDAPDAGVRRFQESGHDSTRRRLDRKLLAKQRSLYGVADRNRTYTVRASHHAHERRLHKARRADGRFVAA